MNHDVQHHNKGLDKIVKRLTDSGKYVAIAKNINYTHPESQRCGEIDVLAIHRSGAIFLFEYKCSDNSKREGKAKDQLNRARGYVNSATLLDGRVEMFYVHGENMVYKREQI